MNISNKRNIIVLKDLPSNLVDEAIIILKNASKVKNKEKTPKIYSNSKFSETSDCGDEIAIKEAEYLVSNYMQKIEKPRENTNSLQKIKMRYKKLQICSVMLGIVAIIGIIISILK